MLIYFICTVIALNLDFIVICMGIDGLNDSDAFDKVFVFILGVLYWFISFYFIGKIISIRMGLPDYA